jgi:Uma2 family endonuclease
MTYTLTRKLIDTVAYHRMGEVGILTEHDRVELIHGEIIEMSPIGSLHASVLNRISNFLNQNLGKRAIISIQNPIYISDLSEPQPDVAILKPAPDFYAKQHPGGKDTLLIVEVADTSLAYDREVKLPLYAAVGVPEYWLVNLKDREIEAYHTPLDNTYKTRNLYRPGDALTFYAFDLSVAVNDLLGNE